MKNPGNHKGFPGGAHSSPNFFLQYVGHTKKTANIGGREQNPNHTLSRQNPITIATTTYGAIVIRTCGIVQIVSSGWLTLSIFIVSKITRLYNSTFYNKSQSKGGRSHLPNRTFSIIPHSVSPSRASSSACN